MPPQFRFSLAKCLNKNHNSRNVRIVYIYSETGYRAAEGEGLSQGIYTRIHFLNVRMILHIRHKILRALAVLDLRKNKKSAC